MDAPSNNVRDLPGAPLDLRGSFERSLARWCRLILCVNVASIITVALLTFVAARQ